MVKGICSRERLPEDERSSGVCKVGIRRYNTGREKAQTMNNFCTLKRLNVPFASGGPILVQHSLNVGEQEICTVGADFCCLNTDSTVCKVKPEFCMPYYKHLGCDPTMTSLKKIEHQGI